MNLEKKIGQLFILGFKGDKVDESDLIVRDIVKRNLGGVILFDCLLAHHSEKNNIVSASQVKNLTNKLQEFADTPLFIAIDQEGGRVQRLKPKLGFPETLSAETLGGYDDTTLTTIHGLVCADTLQSLGVNFNLAPVVDLNNRQDNPVIAQLGRSFSKEPSTVSKHATAWIDAHTRRNVISCLKHFPGHGSSQTDSHLGFTDISDYWQEEELLPFRTMIKAGVVDAIMTGHLFHRGLDPSYPASLSTEIIQTLLRDQLQFEGVVVSDDLQMKGVREKYTLEEAVCLGIQAGTDLFIVGNNLEYEPMILSRLIKTICSMVEEGVIAEALIDKACGRIAKLKATFI